MMNDKSISILGCGWLGKALAIHLIKNGYKDNVDEANSPRTPIYPETPGFIF